MSVSLGLGLLVALWTLFLSPVKCVAPSLNVPACTEQIASDWAFNSLMQSPCMVAGFLGSVCTNNTFALNALSSTDGDYFLTSQNATNCSCSSVYYNTLSACASCQGAKTWESWDNWSNICSSVFLVYPNPIPSGTAIPNWAFQNVTEAGTFNVAEAQSAGDLPESAAPSSSTGAGSTPTGSSTSASTSSSSSSSASPSSGGKTNVGAIVGGVVGAIVFLSVSTYVIFLIIRRSQRQRRNKVRSDSPPILDDSVIPRPFIIQQSSPPPKLYNPSDPTTFPSSPMGPQSTGGSHQMRSVSHYHSISDSSGYPGMAEI